MQCARQTHCQFGNNSRAKWDPSQSSEGSGKKINNIKIKLNTPITSKFFTGFWFNVNPPKISYQFNVTIKHSLKKKVKILYQYCHNYYNFNSKKLILSRVRLILSHCLSFESFTLSLLGAFCMSFWVYFLNGKKHLMVGMLFMQNTKWIN